LKKSRPVRIRFKFRVEVRGSRQEFVAEARDISVAGLCLSSPIRMQIGDRAGTSLCFPGRRPVSLSFEIRWARPDAATRTLLGVEFVHTAESRKAMESLMWEIQSGAVQGEELKAGSRRSS
jgi:hypothetical protein